MKANISIKGKRMTNSENMNSKISQKKRRVINSESMNSKISQKKRRMTIHARTKANNLKKNPQMKIQKTNRKPETSLGSMSVDDFMNGGFDLSSESENDEIHSREEKTKTLKGEGVDRKNDHVNNAYEKGDDPSSDGGVDECVSENKTDGDDTEDEANQQDNGDTNWTSANFSHKKAVAMLQETDPEFYKYLEENDKDLLNFDESDSDDDSKEDDERGGKLHIPPENLEVASDESDYEDGTRKDSRIITLKMVEDWDTRLQTTTNKSCVVIKEVVNAFHAVYVKVSNEEDNSARYVVTGSNVFNAVVRLCVLELQPALKRYLNIKSGSQVDPTKHVRWHIVKRTIKFYLENLVKLILGVTSSQVTAVLLKHCHQMVSYISCFPKTCRMILKVLVNLWSQGEETTRVLAFLCILRLVNSKQDELLEPVLKTMYLSYIRNCKFMSPTTLPAINFMRLCLVEMFALNLNIGYKHVFLYIRQLAIQLRNAMNAKTKVIMQSVCNWQVINSLHLWADVLGSSANKPQLQSLVYPFVQVTLGTINLIPTAQYFPLRFHCLQMLIQVSKKTCTLIPILPLILEVFKKFNFNTRHKVATMKPLDFTFINRVSKIQLEGNGFKEATIDKVYELLLEYLTNESNSIAFPDLVIPTVIELRGFLKDCKDSKVCRKLKQLLDKIKSNAEMIEMERRKVSFQLKDQKAIAAWETQIQLKGTPLTTFYQNWKKVYDSQQAKKITQAEELGEFNVPVIRRRSNVNKDVNSNERVSLLPSDSEDDLKIPKIDDDEPVRKKRNRKKGGKPTSNVEKSTLRRDTNYVNFKNDEQDDVVEDLKWKDFK